MYRIVEKKGRGRCVVAAKDIEPGVELFTERGFASESFGPSVCSYCFRDLGSRTVILGAECNQNVSGAGRYCSETCRSNDAYVYSLMCPVLPSIETVSRDCDVDGVLLRLVLKIVSTRIALEKDANLTAEIGQALEASYKAFSSSNGAPLFASYQQAYDMIDHVENAGDSWKSAVTKALVALKEENKELELFASESGDGSPFYNVEEALKLACKINSNSHQITTREVTRGKKGDALDAVSIDETSDYVCGLGLFPNLALLNHSCIPNVFYFGERGFNRVKTARKVKSGEELCISYIDAYQTREKRQEELLKTKHFLCSCERCTPAVSGEGLRVDDYINGVCCNKCGKDGLILESARADQVRNAQDADLEKMFADFGESTATKGKKKGKSKAARKTADGTAGTAYECLLCRASVPSGSIEMLRDRVSDRISRGKAMYSMRDFDGARKYYESIVNDLTISSTTSSSRSKGALGTALPCSLHPQNFQVYDILPKLYNCCRYSKEYILCAKYAQMIVDSMDLVYPEVNLEKTTFLLERASVLGRLKTAKKKVPPKTMRSFRTSAIEGCNKAIAVRKLIFGDGNDGSFTHDSLWYAQQKLAELEG